MPWLRFLLALTLLFPVILALEAVAATPTSESDSKALQNLLQRWLSLPEVQLIVGRLPNQLPVHLPLPDKAQVVGSIIKPLDSFEIILDVQQSPEQVQAFYYKELKSAGWQEQKQQDNSLENTGFLASTSHLEKTTNQGITFCSQSKKAKLNIQASNLFRSLTEVRPEVRLNLEVFRSTSSSNFKCSSSDSVKLLLLPPLIAPSNVAIDKNITISGDRASYSYAVLDTKLETQVLAAHYSTQLEQVGWKRSDSVQNERGFWSTWTLKDNKGQSKQGLLSITQLAGVPNQYIAYVKCQ